MQAALESCVQSLEGYARSVSSVGEIYDSYKEFDTEIYLLKDTLVDVNQRQGREGVDYMKVVKAVASVALKALAVLALGVAAFVAGSALVTAFSGGLTIAAGIKVGLSLLAAHTFAVIGKNSFEQAWSGKVGLEELQPRYSESESFDICEYAEKVRAAVEPYLKGTVIGHFFSS